MAIRRAVVYHAQVAQAINAGIKGWHCILYMSFVCNCQNVAETTLIVREEILNGYRYMYVKLMIYNSKSLCLQTTRGFEDARNFRTISQLESV